MTSEALRADTSDLGSILHASIYPWNRAGNSQEKKKPWKLRAAADANSSNPPGAGAATRSCMPVLLPVIFAEKKKGHRRLPLTSGGPSEDGQAECGAGAW